jgi:predicted MFS family arabinose efflux permease
MTRLGTAALVVGVVLFVLALASTSLALFVVSAVVAGGGFGSGFLGALRNVTQLAQPHERAALLSAVYLVSYLGFSIPALVAGLVISHEGLRDTAMGYGVFVGVLTLAALIVDLVRERRAVPAA